MREMFMSALRKKYEADVDVAKANHYFDDEELVENK